MTNSELILVVSLLQKDFIRGFETKESGTMDWEDYKVVSIAQIIANQFNGEPIKVEGTEYGLLLVNFQPVMDLNDNPVTKDEWKRVKGLLCAAGAEIKPHTDEETDDDTINFIVDPIECAVRSEL